MFTRIVALVILANLAIVVSDSSGSGCGGDPNAMNSQCGNNCLKSCVKTRICSDICIQNGCECKDGFLFDAKSNKCVLPAQCPKQCGTNEVFTKCSNARCSTTKCSQLGKPLPCKRQRACVSGCVCKAGFLQDNDGNCLPRNNCQRALCPNQNEVFDPCFTSCSPGTCDSIGKNFNCPLIPANNSCTGKCRCKDNFYRNAISECISEAECKKCNGSHEYFSCGGACDNVCSTLSEQNQTNCLIINIVCNKMCYCESEFARDDDDICVPIDDCPVSGNEAAVLDFNQGTDAFTGEFIYQMFQLNMGRSFVASPFSVLIPLAQLCLFAKGSTFDQIIRVLNLETKDQIRSVFPVVIQNYKEQSEIELLLAAKIYADQDFPLGSEFKTQSLQVFGAEAENIDFDDPSEAANIINSWVSDNTDGFIQELVTPSFISPNTRLILTNVIFFLGNWSLQFDEQNTIDRVFFLNDNDSIQIKTMFQENTFKYFESSTLNSQVLQLFYKGGNVSCVIVLPKQKGGINDLINKVRNGNTVLEAVNAANFQKVRMFLPLVNTTSAIDLKQILQQDNITSLFAESSDLEGILQNPEMLKVDNAIQVSRIVINEKGTEAAAANAIGVSATAAIFPPPPVFDFIADHPFLYYILLEDTPIFCGCFSGPQ